MTDFSDSPIKKILFDKLVEMGRLDPNPTKQTMQTINEISDSDALKLLKSLPGGGPELKNMGGMMDINNMTRPVGYENGGDVKKNIITRRLASTRGAKSFEDFLKDITNPDTGEKFTKVDEKTGKIRGAKGDWAKYLNSKNIKVGSLAATDELNRLSKIRYVDIASAGKNFSEDIISAITGTEPGERGARDIRNATNSKIVEIKKVATQAEGANSTKAKQKLLTTLFEKSFPVLKQVPKYATLLSTAIASKAFGYMPIATEMGDAELPKEPMIDKKKIDFSGPSANAQLLEQMSQDAAMNKRGGGMMNMDEMIRPLGYKEGTREGTTVGDREDIVQKTNEMITYLNARVEEQSFGTEPAAKIINDITEERRKENPDYDRLNQMYLEYKDMDDFASKVYFTDKYDEPEKKGRSKEGFLNRILNTIHDVTMRPKDTEIGYNTGGLASINQMTRPVYMAGGGIAGYAGGGDAEKENLLQTLETQLMLSRGMKGSMLFPEGNKDTIKRLESKIKQIKMELGKD